MRLVFLLQGDQRRQILPEHHEVLSYSASGQQQRKSRKHQITDQSNLSKFIKDCQRPTDRIFQTIGALLIFKCTYIVKTTVNCVAGACREAHHHNASNRVKRVTLKASGC